jgi:HSP20 family molecular chaperone IbpA
MAEKTVQTAAAASSPQTMEGTRTRERYVTTPVDIYETSEGLVVMADMPGVDQNALDIRVDNHILTLRGMARHMAPGEPIYREYELVNYFRQFELSDRVDESKISADLKHGVLTVHLPKAEEAKPRRISVQVG